MKMKNVKLLITDLDDTIWDWLSMWHNSFTPYLDRIENECNIDRKKLINDFKSLHQKYHTSEVSYAYRELNTLKSGDFNTIERDSENNIGIIHEYYRNKKINLKIYDNVLETLQLIKSKGTRIIGFTESNIFYTKWRIKTLNLDGIFDIIYSPEDHELPTTVSRVYEPGHWELDKTQIKKLPHRFKKPNPEILLKILEENNATVYDAIYIGDKLDRDIYMANQINLTSVHASYGNIIDSEAYDLLREVTHWQKSEVKREISVKKEVQKVRIKPDYIIHNFNELVKIFNFEDYYSIYTDDCVYSDKDKENIINIWKNVVEVQKHFNDIEIRIRNFAISIFTFIFAGIGFCIKENVFIYKHGVSLSFASLVAFVGIIVITALYIMDKHWYHRLLHASVSQGLDIEKSLSNFYPHINLTTKIKSKSPTSFFLKKFNIHSDGKLRIFYLMLIVPFLLAFIGLLIYNSDLELNSEYNHVKNNAKRISLQNVDKLPINPGLVIGLEKYGKLSFVNETNNIYNYISDYLKNDTSIISQTNIYYSETRIARKELEEMIKINGIKIDE